MRLTLLLLIGLFGLTACDHIQNPRGTGSGTDSLPGSPCACEPFYENGEWIG